MPRILILVSCSNNVTIVLKENSTCTRVSFKKSKLCIPHSSMRELLVRKAHGRGLMGHFGIAKTLGILHEHFFWPQMKHVVERMCSKCITCKQAKSR